MKPLFGKPGLKHAHRADINIKQCKPKWQKQLLEEDGLGDAQGGTNGGTRGGTRVIRMITTVLCEGFDVEVKLGMQCYLSYDCFSSLGYAQGIRRSPLGGATRLRSSALSPNQLQP